MNRREYVKLAVSALAFRHIAGCGAATTVAPPTAPSLPAAGLTADDSAFLDDLQRRGCLYFVEQASPVNGQVLDRAAATGNGSLDTRRMASVAAAGFGLTALCIADKRGYLPHADIVAQVERTLRYHADEVYNNHGFFYHFTDIETGQRFANNEVSSIDTSLLLCGVLTARAYFSDNATIHALATSIYERVDWPWMLNGGDTFSMGWKPETGFLNDRWNRYSELMMLYLLAIGSPSHPVDARSWDAWSRPMLQYKNFEYIGGNDPLFPVLYSHAWFDFRAKRDKYANYFDNAVLATRAHEAFCIDWGKPYSLDYWGVSASDSQHGYTAWGGPSTTGASYGGMDGSVVPHTTAGTLPFLPSDCLRVLKSLKQSYGNRAWGRYGFCDAFYPAAAWYDPDVLGIDLGTGVLMAENLRTGFVWETFARNPEVSLAMSRVGFHAA
jgi:hypothetical protein